MMRGKLLAAMAVGALASGAALAGLNPNDPGLPTVTTASIFGGNVARNHMSAMCLDCHTQAPKPAATNGTHFVATTNNSNSGGSGISAAGIATRDAGEYYKLDAWPNASVTVSTIAYPGFSKYGDNAARQSKAVGKTPNGVAVVEAAGASYDAYEIICESCHNIIVNAPGGNNLLDVNENTATGNAVDWEQAAESSLCVGCHGFMYTAAAGAAATANSGNANYADTRNVEDYGAATRRGNNEVHWIKGAVYPQNHHVMTGDNINATTAAAGILWTDNVIVSYTDAPIVNNSALGTYAVNGTWALPYPTNTARLACTNCHAVAHDGGRADGASILRNVTALAANTRTNAWDRISDAGRWKKFNDGEYCGQCHAR